MNNSDADMLPTNEIDTPLMVRKIGRTTYETSYHFSATNTETVNDKIKRLIKQDMER